MTIRSLSICVYNLLLAALILDKILRKWIYLSSSASVADLGLVHRGVHSLFEFIKVVPSGMLVQFGQKDFILIHNGTNFLGSQSRETCYPCSAPKQR